MREKDKGDCEQFLWLNEMHASRMIWVCESMTWEHDMSIKSSR